MSSLKEWVEKRLEQERVNLRRACDEEDEKEEANAFTAKWTLRDVRRELKSIQLELLYKLQANLKAGNDASRRDDFSTVAHFVDVNSGVLIVYRRLFGQEERDKIHSGKGIYQGLDNVKISDRIEEVKK